MSKTANKHPVTIERAKLVVEKAPGFSRDLLVDHVRDALASAYDDGKRAGELAARETMIRSQIAFWEGVASQAKAATVERAKELRELLAALGKVTT
jgi:hypothetical protein